MTPTTEEQPEVTLAEAMAAAADDARAIFEAATGLRAHLIAQGWSDQIAEAMVANWTTGWIEIFHIQAHDALKEEDEEQET